MMTRLADGDRAAMGPVFAAVWPIVRGFAARALSGPDADDVAQEALVSVFARAVEFDRERDALTWILGITMWEVRSARQRQKRRREDRTAVERVDARTPEDELCEREMAAALEELVAQMPAEDARTLHAALGGQRPDVAPATFRKRLSRAMGRLRMAWRSKHGAK
jgi:DNA-directed RNA polymerase specialized sigma24 family protein